MLLVLLACTGAGPDDTATADDTGTDTPTVPDGPGFHLVGTYHGAPFALSCTIATARAAFARSGDQVQLSVGCTDTGSADTPSATLAISGETPGTYSDCANTAGDAMLQVSVGSNASSCALEGGVFDVELAAVDPSGTADLHWSGTVHWEVDTTELFGTFDVTGACSAGC